MTEPTVAVLCGGVGAARFLRGLVRVVPPERITAIVNTGDDIVLHGLHVSPDLDTCMYTLAEAINPDTGWGLRDETWHAMEALGRYGGPNWFNLGDADLGTHLYRTHRLQQGARLSEVTAEMATAWGLGLSLVPITDDRIETRVTVEDEGEIGFQEYFVRRRHDVAVTDIRIRGAEDAAPAPLVLESIRNADVLVIAPSNPLVSIGPVLAVAGVRDAVAQRTQLTVAISPIIAGAALKGPADRMMREMGYESSVVGVAQLYADLADVLIVDDADAAHRSAVEATGLRCIVSPTIMHDATTAASLAQVVLSAGGDVRA